MNRQLIKNNVKSSPRWIHDTPPYHLIEDGEIIANVWQSGKLYRHKHLRVLDERRWVARFTSGERIERLTFDDLKREILA